LNSNPPVLCGTDILSHVRARRSPPDPHSSPAAIICEGWPRFPSRLLVLGRPSDTEDGTQAARTRPNAKLANVGGGSLRLEETPGSGDSASFGEAG